MWICLMKLYICCLCEYWLYIEVQGQCPGKKINIYELCHVHSIWTLIVLLYIQALNCLYKWMLSDCASLGLEAEKGHINCIIWWLLNLLPCHLRNKMKPIAFSMYCNCMSDRNAIKIHSYKNWLNRLLLWLITCLEH